MASKSSTAALSSHKLINIKYNSLLNLHYKKHTKAIAFADDLLVAIRAENVQVPENFANIEINKITKWAK